MSEICARELRATLLGNQPDWKPTHETAAWVHWYNTRRPHLALGGITPQQAEKGVFNCLCIRLLFERIDA